MQHGALLATCLLASFAAGSNDSALENAVAETLKFFENQQQAEQKLISLLKRAQAAIGGSPSQEKGEVGNDYDADPVPKTESSKSGEENNEAASGSLLEKFSKFKPTRTNDGVLHMKLAQKPGEETVYKFNVNELRELAKTAKTQEDSPPKKSGKDYSQNEGGTDYNENNYNYPRNDYSAAALGSSLGLRPQPLQRRVEVGNDYSDEPNKSGGQDSEAASGSLMEKFSQFKPTRTNDGVLHMKLAQKPGEESVYKFNVNELRELAKTAKTQKSDYSQNEKGTDYYDDYNNNYHDYSAAPRGSPSWLRPQPPQRRVEVGNDYSDEPSNSGGQNNEAASGSLLEKFSKFKPTRTNDGVLHMKLAQKPGEESVYKFNVNELRELAKTAKTQGGEGGTDYNDNDYIYPGNDYSAAQRGLPSLLRPQPPQRRVEVGKDYSDEPEAASGSLMEKFSKFRPTRTNDGVLHMNLAQKPGEESVYKFNVNELRELAKTAKTQEDSPTRKSGNDYSQNEKGTDYNGKDYNYHDYSAAPRGSSSGLKPQSPQREVEAGNDYSDEPKKSEPEPEPEPESSKSGEENKEAASGELLEKFSKFKPTRTKDGVLHMKLAQKPGEESVYKFNVNELRKLAKTAHQVDSRRK